MAESFLSVVFVFKKMKWNWKCCQDLSFSLSLLKISIVIVVDEIVVVVEKIHVVFSGVG